MVAGRQDASELLLDMTLAEMFDVAVVKADDIWVHMPALRWLARQHERVTEFGVRNGASTIALLNGNPKVVSYDVERSANHDWIVRAAPEWVFHQQSTLEAVIGETDLLFVDTVHTYDQLSAELARHAGRVSRTIALHDVHVTAEGPENDADGMRRAVQEFCQAGGWEIVFDTPWCNGFTVICRLL
jgi:predicted O-methyltransferase YrrM